METIKSYLNNVFGTLPETRELLDLKNELLNNMLDKYEDLKADGKTENEAIGIVISEFGNIDELLQEMNMTQTEKGESNKKEAFVKPIGLEEAMTFIKLKSQTAHLIGLGVGLILIGVSLLIGLSTLIDNQLILKATSKNFQDILPILLLFLFIAPAVALFIFSGVKLEAYQYIEEGQFELSASAEAVLTKDYAHTKPQSLKGVIVGVSLCVLSPIAVLIGPLFGDIASSLSVCLLLMILAGAVYILIYSAATTDGYKQLLKLEEFKIEKKRENKVIGAVAGIVWPLAVCIFLVAGLVFNLWSISWIIFPVTGILFGGFCAFYTAIRSQE